MERTARPKRVPPPSNTGFGSAACAASELASRDAARRTDPARAVMVGGARGVPDADLVRHRGRWLRDGKVVRFQQMVDPAAVAAVSMD